jgi:hypothetical protein
MVEASLIEKKVKGRLKGRLFPDGLFQLEIDNDKYRPYKGNEQEPLNVTVLFHEEEE